MKGWVFDAVALVLFLVLATAGIWAAGQIRGISFDPLGSAAVPYGVCALILLLSIVSAWQSWRAQARPANETPDVEPLATEDIATRDIATEDGAYGDRVYSLREMVEVLALLGMVAAYAYALFTWRMPFSLATVILVPSVACLLEGTLRTRNLPIALATGAFLGVGGELLFTRVFYVDLPTFW